MQFDFFEEATRRIAQIEVMTPLGRVASIDNGQVKISGLSQRCHIGDLVHISLKKNGILAAEVVRLDNEFVTVMPDGQLSGLHLGAIVRPQETQTISPSLQWLGRIIDSNGQSLDRIDLPKGTRKIALRSPAPAAADRKSFGGRLRTGSFALNTVLPIVHGQRIGLFAGSGVGKSSLLGILAQNMSCDVVVVALIGERGRELRHFTQDVLGEDGMSKCVIVAETSDKSALERRRCAWTAMAVAEFFRDQGKSVLLLCDSITRFAEAHREVTSATGEMPVLRGHPPSTTQMIAELCERAGPGVAGTGDITAVFTVLVPGSDMEDPIADILRGVLDGHIVLDRQIAERGRYPAIDLLKSVSRSLPNAATPEENSVIAATRHLISLYENNELMVRSGLYNEGADPELDLAVKIWSELDTFLGRCGQNSLNDCFDRLRLILRRAGVQH